MRPYELKQQIKYLVNNVTFRCFRVLREKYMITLICLRVSI